MPRLARFSPIGIAQHVVQRGHDHKQVFCEPSDNRHYLKLLKQYSDECQVQIHAWALMSNHIHLLSTPMVLNGLSKMMQSLAHHYARYFNDKYQHSGGMWGGRFKNSVINSDDYLLRCYLYIELNSVRAGIVQDPCEYRWSSYHENTGRLGNIIVTPHALFSLLGSNRICIRENYKALVAQGLSVEHVRVICKSSRRGGVIV